MSERVERRFDLMHSVSCLCQFPSQIYFPVVICVCFSFQQSYHGNTSLTRFTFLSDKDLPMNGKIISLEFSCSLEIPKIR